MAALDRHSSPDPRQLRMVVAAGGLVAALALLAACGSDSTKSSATTVAAAATTTPEEKVSTDAEVAAGLKALPALVATAVAAAPSGDGAKAFEPIEASWATYEGTVRTKEEDIYLTLEDEFSNLQRAIDAKDAAAAAATAERIDTAAAEYLAKHPG